VRLAFLGYGTIARLVHAEIGRRAPNGIEAVGFLDPGLTAHEASQAERTGFERAQTLSDLMDRRPSIVLEAASQAVAKAVVPQLLEAGIDVLSMSVGAFLDAEVVHRITQNGRARLHLPSGALPGADVVKAAAVRDVRSVELTTRKHPRSLTNAPGVEGRDLGLDGGPEEIFNGTAADAVRLFPENANIAATLSLAGIGPERTRVRIIADPNTTLNTHTVQVVGAFGTFSATVECEVSDNPKTSLLAALSAVALLESIANRIRVGT
jgi:aspartate dehydrogenase